MSATIINIHGEVLTRRTLREIRHILALWLPEGGPSDEEAVRQMRSLITGPVRRASLGTTRLDVALWKIIIILDADYPTPRARIDALWDSDIDRAWLSHALHLPPGMTRHRAVKSDSDAGA